jgi:two-component system, OmpR family, phosphate regulon sensor histidine kinase PhoR
MTRSLRSDLRRVFGLLLGVVVLVGSAGVVATNVTAANLDQATARVTPALQVHDALLQSLTDAETGLRGYVLSARQEALEPYRRGRARLPGARRRLAELLADDPVGGRLYRRELRAVDAWLREYAVPRVDQPVGPGNFDPQLFTRAKVLFDQVRARHAVLQAHLQSRLERLSSEAETVRGLLTAGVVVLTLAGLVVGALATRYTARRVSRPLAALRDVLTDLIAGRQDARATPEGPHEVVTIARSVNALADETERLRAVEADERRLQERMLTFGREVRGTLDPADVVRRGLEELGPALRLGRAYVRLVEDHHLLGVDQQWAAPGVAPLTDVETPGSLSALQAIHRRRTPLVSDDVRADAFYDSERGRRWAEATGARASLTLPIPVDEAPVGVVTCIRFDVHEWTGAEIRLAEAVAADLGRALEHARLYTAQVEAVRRLEDLDRVKDEFLGSVSHELRTPLTSIAGYVELLEDAHPPPTAEQGHLLTVVRRNVDRLRLLIEDLLTLSRIESGAFRSQLQPVDLVAVVQAGVTDLRPQATKAQVEVNLDLSHGALVIDGDHGQLARAVGNVLGNAIKFTPAGGRVDVAVGETADEDAVEVVVRDTGMGIPEADLDEVFTRFFRAGNAVAAGVPGTGLGLVIVRTIVDNHGGRLDLTSRQNEGTTVRLRLPCARVPHRDDHSGTTAERGVL